MDDDISDEDAANNNPEDSGTSNRFKVSDTSNGTNVDSDSDFNVLNPDDRDTPLYV